MKIYLYHREHDSIVEAHTFNEACEKLSVEEHAKPEEISKYTIAEENLDIRFDCSACNEYQNQDWAKGCPLHAWQEQDVNDLIDEEALRNREEPF
jgi:hypothetical protein